jgi:hypothetical protein
VLRFGSAEGRGAAGAPVQRGAGAGGVAARGPAENQQKCSHFQVQSFSRGSAFSQVQGQVQIGAELCRVVQTGAERCREVQRGAEVQIQQSSEVQRC